ncbi:transient receptor potential cation channel subfamily M member 2-like isoform X2 [Glandiceps talaboti]
MTHMLQSFEMRECSRFTVPEGQDDDSDHIDGPTRAVERLCHCGRDRSTHTDELSATESKRWESSTHTDTKKTNTYGEIEFPGYSVKPAKYIRLEHMTDPDKIVQLMTQWWGLSAPNLLISVTGGAKDFMLTSKLKAVFRNGLTKVALSTNAWIITGGTHTGVMKHVGEAVRDYTLGSGSYGRRSIVNIGVVPWGVVHRRQRLINEGGKSTYKVRYLVEDPVGLEASLDPNHSHFILVDNGSSGSYGTEIELRGKLERAISEIHQGKDKDGNLMIPTVCLVLEGGPGTLETVRSAIYNNTPVVIVAGSGRAADLLTWAVRNVRTERTNSVLKKLKNEAQNIFGLQLVDKVVSLVLDCMKKETLELITVYELNAKGFAMDIDVAILQALLTAKKADKRGQLHLALAMNRIDIAESVMCQAGRSWKVEDRHQLLEKAFINNQVEFVKLFIENGVDLRTFLTVKRLTTLYNKIRHTTLLYRLLKKVKSRSVTKKCQRTTRFTLRDVGHLIKDLADNTYEVLYLRHDNKYQVQDGDQNSNEEIGVFAKPRRELFLWAVFLNRHEMAKLFLESMSDAMAAALVASRFLKSMAERETDEDNRLRLTDRTQEYEQLAYAILTECYNADEEATLLLLVRPLHFWGNSTCLRLAISADDKNFVAHTAVQELLSRIWYGNVDSERTSTLSLFCCLLFPPLLYCVLTFREPHVTYDNDESEFTSLDQGTTVYKSEVTHDVDSTPLVKLNRDHRLSIEEGSASLGSNEGIDIRAKKDLRPFQKFVSFLDSPVVKFSYCTFWYVIFLLLFSRVLLVDYKKHLSTPEIMLIIWVTTFVFDEIRQLIQRETSGFYMKITSWIFDDYWNIIDFISLGGFYAAIIVKYSGDLDAGRYILAVDILFFYIRIMHIFSINRTIGPKLIMIGKMMVDLFFFVGIICVIMIGYGVSVQAILYPDEQRTWPIMNGIFYKPYFQIYGELFLEEFEVEGCTTNETSILSGEPRCERYHTLVIILLAVYMVLSNILLVNLLIAMFSYTFSKVQDHTDLFWKFQRYGLIAEYQWRPMLFPPLIIFSHIRMCVQAVLGHCCPRIRRGKRTLRQRLTVKEDKLLSLFELIHMERYFARKQHEESTKMDVEIKEVFQKVDSLMKHMEFVESQLDRIMTRTDERYTEDVISPLALPIISEEADSESKA